MSNTEVKTANKIITYFMKSKIKDTNFRFLFLQINYKFFIFYQITLYQNRLVLNKCIEKIATFFCFKYKIILPLRSLSKACPKQTY